MSYYRDCEPVALLHERRRKARRAHTCVECNRYIERGETYLVERIVDDGRAYTMKTCLQCLAVREWVSREFDGYVYGMVYEDASEAGGHMSAVVYLMGKSWFRDGRLVTAAEVAAMLPNYGETRKVV